MHSAAKPKTTAVFRSPAGIESGRAAGFEVLEIPSPAEVAALLRRRLEGC